MEPAQLIIQPPQTPPGAKADEIAQIIRERYAEAIAKTWPEYRHPYHWKIFNAYLMTDLIHKQAKCEWEEARQACIAHFPELFAEYWMNLPYDPEEKLPQHADGEYSIQFEKTSKRQQPPRKKKQQP